MYGGSVRRERYVEADDPLAKLVVLAQKYCRLEDYTKKLEVAYENYLKRYTWSAAHYASRKRSRTASRNKLD